ncbi:hypothetical protein K461DRAFT_223778 [Myriangium duriaei CBS 260.36]|uniref:AAA+ ATPase domain-containing protein n=1 Tax=Myriangium duriaei CBS 260.36 TaxID=1168546 RepID=A0A9P4J4C4_9PEZI|nr:hypothetical protein K461DRAFT_223778 [Myriangium duriaei CBS 260.36]
MEDSDDDDESQNPPPLRQKRVASFGKENTPTATTNIQEGSLGKVYSKLTPAAPSLGASILSQTTTNNVVPPNSADRRTAESTWIARTTGGAPIALRRRAPRTSASYQQIVAARSEEVAGRARRSYYGIEINALLDQADAEIAISKQTRQEAAVVPTTEDSVCSAKDRSSASLMWTEKYRARKFTDLVGDDRTHRTVMHWLKAWDPIVFPGSSRRSNNHKKAYQADAEQKEHRKVLLLTGPPGLGKTTLAHVCARQAGYEVTEINASDERSKDVVKGRIRDMLGTENVKSASHNAAGTKKVAKPICVIVDEVDGVVSGSGGGGEGGFVKALIDLILLDQRNARNAAQGVQTTATGKKKKGDIFRMMRPLVMICNDAYHPALRLLRTSHLVEIIHCGKPALNNVASRVQAIFEREGVGADGDAVRRLCEGCWGTTSKKEGGAGAGAGDGDIRSVLVMGEWVARRIRAVEDDAASTDKPRLTKKWLEKNLVDPSANGAVRGLGRGGTREIVDRVFMEGAGLSKPTTTLSTHLKMPSSDRETLTSVKSVNEAIKAASASHLRTLIDGHGETDRVITDVFSQYPSQPFQDDTFLTKPSQAYDWLHFHDQLSSAVFSSSEWELAPYLSSPILGFHHLFSTSAATRARYASDTTSTYAKATSSLASDAAIDEPHPFSTPQASFAAHERERQNAALLQSLHDSLSLPLTRLFPRPATMAAEFIPFVLRMLSPAVNPVLITSSAGPGAAKFDNKTTASVRKASEKALVERAVKALIATGLRFQRHKVEGTVGVGKASGGFVYRLTLPVDEYGVYETAPRGWGNDVAGVSAQGGRYGVRQVLVQECTAEERRREGEARKRRGNGEEVLEEVVEEDKGLVVAKKVTKRDFFGRVVGEEVLESTSGPKKGRVKEGEKERRVWVSFHEGYSNAVRKPVTLAELMRGL